MTGDPLAEAVTDAFRARRPKPAAEPPAPAPTMDYVTYDRLGRGSSAERSATGTAGTTSRTTYWSASSRN
jgi:ribosomal protein L13E